jgi:glycosyltransferase involved in cell wall biosynthesis
MSQNGSPVSLRPRVLVVSENESVPGDRRVWDISTTLAASGAEVVVVCPQDNFDGLAEFERLEGVEIHRYRPSLGSGGALGYIREYTRAFWSTWRLVRRLSRRRSFDVVHACNPPDFLLFAAWPARRRGARLIFDHHDLSPELFTVRFGDRRRLLYRLTRILERMSLRMADVVIATNASYRDVACLRGGKRAEDVFVVPNAPDLRRLSPVAPEVSLKRGSPLLVAYVGVMAPQDGVDHALEALALLRARRGDWHAVLAGDGPARGDLIAQTQELGLGDCVEFVGWLGDEQIVSLLSTADVCLSPEPKNALNDVSTLVKVAEYMAMSRPVVAFSLQETRRTAGEAAAYAEPNDVADFAARIEDLLNDPERRAAMAELGRARVETSMTWEHSTVELHAAYRRALAGRDATSYPAPVAACSTVDPRGRADDASLRVNPAEKMDPCCPEGFGRGR